MATVKITNTLTNVISGATGVEAVISPTGIPTPGTPVQEYVSDMVTITDGTLKVPAYNKVQSIYIPAGAYVEFEVTDYKEVNYYENLEVDGAKIEITDGITVLGDEYELLTTEPDDWATNWTAYYTLVDGEYVAVTGDSAPTFEANTYYKKK